MGKKVSPKPDYELETHVSRNSRYTYEGAFRMEFIPNDKIKLQLVGMGFEARDTSEVVHEEYTILWKDLPKLRETLEKDGSINFDELSFVNKTVIGRDKYRISAKNRLDFLVDACGFPVYLVLDFLSMTSYHEIGDESVRRILQTFIYDEDAGARITYGELIGSHIKSWYHSYNAPVTEKNITIKTWDHSYNTPMYWY
ncbi:hypothetical protein IKG73_02910 [Candidatus Saccharibacteria bacterium]|nr:hypothetical protein [Candidatus Saccharibacteria bacterium]